jgi:single-stranded-DNA-specific exonuclease
MAQLTPQWQVRSWVQPPDWLVAAIHHHAPEAVGLYAAQLMWQRGISDPTQIAGFLDPQHYEPASPLEFGLEMSWAIERLQRAQAQQETVAIWGDFDADGVTATAVLWDGLGQFFPQNQQLFYYIPNRITESHGLSEAGLHRLKQLGCSLIVTCDTGSTHRAEIELANHWGMEVIVTDHHTLPDDRPPVVAILNPRQLPPSHPLATLSGVAVAYKLVEALYQAAPTPPAKPLEHLLDLVAIGLIADLVELRGDCRYLAQRGIDRLQQQLSPDQQTRPGVARLLELCKRSGDRPTDISFGLGPRINAVSRIQGDAHFCVELLTSQDGARCRELAEATELANTRRKALQRDVYQQVVAKLAQLDLSTTSVIVLVDAQWAVGVLGLVAGQIAQEYGCPTILLSTESSEALPGDGDNAAVEGAFQSSQNPKSKIQNPKSPIQNPKSKIQNPKSPPLARGSARSVNQIDLYQLVQEQAHLLHRFGGHPFAAGLSLPVENIPLFTEAVNQKQRQMSDGDRMSSVQADLVVTVSELGKRLFQELKLLEPCGMGNPVPRLLIQNCWFEQVWNRNITDWKGGKQRYIQTEFLLRDDSASTGFAGVWWGHYKDEIPSDRCDAIMELDSNSYKKRYEVRLIAVRAAAAMESVLDSSRQDWLIDLRHERAISAEGDPLPIANSLVLHQCPTSWSELQIWFRRAIQEQRSLAIAYAPTVSRPPIEIWQQLAGIAKYLSRTGNTATRQQLYDKLGIGDRPLQLGLYALRLAGFAITYQGQAFHLTWQADGASDATDTALTAAIEQFLTAIQEEHFRRQYFYQIPFTMMQAVAKQTGIQVTQ